MPVRMLFSILISLILVSVVVGNEHYPKVSPAQFSAAFHGYELPQKECRADEVDSNEVKFYLYTRQNLHKYELHTGYNCSNSYESLRNSTYNVRKETKFLIHAWTQSPKDINDIIYIYLYAENVNVIMVDWSMYSQTCNYNSTSYVVIPKVAKALSDLMKLLTGYGAVPQKNFHVIGFLHGAHIAGIAGKYISPLRISRISGLDPVGYNIDGTALPVLQNGDADFIDVIYTSIEYYGTQRQIGDLSFYPDRGTHPQKQCPPDPNEWVCSALASIKYWRESITSPTAFSAIRCDNYVQYHESRCPGPNTTMGEYASRNAPFGKYYLNTNPEPPYSQS
uniref:Cochineal major allergen n=1 Tax=Protortonia cacti TaxID=553176 RepID=C4B4W5_9HEMI|nr:cochineal major allergen [Protortonia cacti]